LEQQDEDGLQGKIIIIIIIIIIFVRFSAVLAIDLVFD
jgi:flagellar basal body-associated protein FliL